MNKEKEEIMIKKMKKIDSILKACCEDISTSSETDRWAAKDGSYSGMKCPNVGRSLKLPRLTNLHNGREIVIVKRQITDKGTILYHAHRYEDDNELSVFDKCLCRFDLENWVVNDE